MEMYVTSCANKQTAKKAKASLELQANDLKVKIKTQKEFLLGFTAFYMEGNFE